MASRWQAEKEAVLGIAQEMVRKGLVVGSAGNVSVRLGPETLAITPSRRRYEEMTAEDIQVVDFDGEPVEGDLVPSVETLLHAAAYRTRRDCRAVVHTHSVHASALAVARMSLPPVLDELVALVGGDVPVAGYAFPSSEELAGNAARVLSERNAVLLANHGVVGIGGTLREALTVCELVEHAARVFILARGLGGVHALPPEIVELEQGLFRARKETAEQGR
jgi:L-fuculose-phosphate aldolase